MLQKCTGNELWFKELKADTQFEENIVLPYFNDIFIDLTMRSHRPGTGINKITFLEYSRLPVFLGERLFSVID